MTTAEQLVVCKRIKIFPVSTEREIHHFHHKKLALDAESVQCSSHCQNLDL